MISLGWDILLNTEGPYSDVEYIGTALYAGKEPYLLVNMEHMKVWLKPGVRVFIISGPVRSIHGYLFYSVDIPGQEPFRSMDNGWYVSEDRLTNIRMFPKSASKLSWDTERYKSVNRGQKFWDAIEEDMEVVDQSGGHFIVMSKFDDGIQVRDLQTRELIFVPKDFVILSGNLGAHIVQ